MSKKVKAIIAIVAIAAMVFAIAFVGVKISDNAGKTKDQISAEDTITKLSKFVEKKVNLSVKENPVKGNVDLTETSLKDELPDISKYPFKVKGNGEINIEIFSSPEKAGSETSNGDDPKSDTWLIEVVNSFNKSGYTVGGKKVSVSLRSVSSGLAADYISSGVYVPDGFSPSNEYWAAMLKAKGVKLNQVSKSLVGNVAGILLKKDTYNTIIKNYGAVNINTITEAVSKNEIAMGYTNPYASSAGLNFLMSSLYCFDSSNPLSETAIEGFKKFQSNVPFVAYNTMQMRNAVNSGVLDGMIMEYQSYTNDQELRNYIFTPYGVRHDNPLYSIGDISSEKQEAFKLFAEFATNKNSQESAKNYGFNQKTDYVSEVPDSDGDTLVNAQKLWKKEKDNGQEIVAVFIIDTSGSVDGAPLNEMKTSLINAAQYISSEHYIGLVSYNNDVTVNLPISKFDLNQRSYFNGEVSNLSAGGGTATFDAIAVGMQMLENARVDHPDAKFMLFVLSDGESNRGSLRDVSGFIENLKIPVYTIGYNANVAALKEISSINEAASINADTDDIIYKLKSLFNAQM
ncbi:MAG: VWA domain-containing protein [Candidatus Scatovivens sp.]